MSYTVSEDALVRAKIAREKQTERILNVALPVVGMKAIEKVRELLSVYDERIYLWLAGLYDKNIGGFYFSNSARDTDGFLPDIESTAQAIRMLKSSGLFDEDVPYVDIFSSETTNKIVNFFTSRQAPDGYFYHPQWGENISSNRKQRDRRWALSSLEKFNATPNVTVPLNDGETAVNFEFLESTEDFKKHLSEIDLSKSPLEVATRLISIGTHVKRAGQDYVDELKRWLEKWSWLWVWQETENYDSVNAFVKICVEYKIMDLIIPYTENIFEASVKRIEKDVSSSVMGCDNPWKTMNTLFNLISKRCDQETVYSLRTRLWRRAPELIEKTRERVLDFQNPDGTFRYNNSNQNTAYGAPVGVKGVAEGSINATAIASTSTVANMCYALGIPKIDIFCIEDGRIFLDAMQSD
jgi:hypothetical protein